MNAAVLAPLASLRQLATPPTLPEALASLTSDARPPDGIGVPILDESQAMSGTPLVDRPVRDPVFANWDADVSAWDPLADPFTEGKEKDRWAVTEGGF
jgi:hypothetical protein